MTLTDKKALIYCRVSTNKQEHEGSGLSSQEKRCQEYANFKGYEVEIVFRDAFSGGGDFMKRPAMRSLLEYVDKHPHNSYVVIFDDLKRFARDLKFHWELRAEFQARNLIPECLNFKFEETPEGAFIETIIAAQGELEREQNKRQVIQKMKSRMMRGIYCLPSPQFGYAYIRSAIHGGKVLQIVQEEAEIIREAYKGFSNGKYFHIKDVAHFLNTQTRKDKRPFTLDTVKRILTNILYTGHVEYPDWEVPLMKGVHEPIISLKLFEQVQERIHGKIPQRTRKDMREDFPLRGYINCIHCQHPLTASWSTSRSKEKHPYYRCNAKECIMKGKSITQKELHDQYKLYIKKIKPKLEVRNRAKLKILSRAIEKQEEKFTESETYNGKIEAIEQQISVLVGRISANPTSSLVDIYEKEIAKLDKQKLHLEDDKLHSEKIDTKELEPLVDKAFEPFENPYITWTKGVYRQRKLVQNMLFNANLEYGKNTGFGTARKSYILRLYEETEHEMSQNFSRVHTDGISSNLRNPQNLLETHWDEIIKEIREVAEAKTELDNELQTKKAA